MTFEDFARSVRDSPEYRESVRIRACAGTLPPDVELFLLEMADGRMPMAADRSAGEPVQSRTLALVRPSARTEEVQS